MEISKFNCLSCKFKTNKKCSYDSHLLTKKHINIDKCSIENNFECKNCNKKYKSKAGLWKHKKNCIEKKEEIKIETTENNTLDTNSMNYLINLVTENSKKIEELLKNNTTTTINNNTTNTTNNIFTIFLDEKCNKAKNFSDLLADIKKKITINDLKDIINDSYNIKILDLMVGGIDTYSVKQRPLHYIKGTEENTIHVRENDKWNAEKEGKEYIMKHCIDKFQDGIKEYANNQMQKQKIDNVMLQDFFDETNRYDSSPSLKEEFIEKLKGSNVLNEGMITGPFG